MLKIFKKLFDNEYKELERFKGIADQIVALDDMISELSDKELKEYTKMFREIGRFGNKQSTILPRHRYNIWLRHFAVRKMRNENIAHTRGEKKKTEKRVKCLTGEKKNRILKNRTNIHRTTVSCKEEAERFWSRNVNWNRRNWIFQSPVPSVYLC